MVSGPVFRPRHSIGAVQRLGSSAHGTESRPPGSSVVEIPQIIGLATATIIAFRTSFHMRNSSDAERPCHYGRLIPRFLRLRAELRLQRRTLQYPAKVVANTSRCADEAIYLKSSFDGQHRQQIRLAVSAVRRSCPLPTMRCEAVVGKWRRCISPATAPSRSASTRSLAGGAASKSQRGNEASGERRFRFGDPISPAWRLIRRNRPSETVRSMGAGRPLRTTAAPGADDEPPVRSAARKDFGRAGTRARTDAPGHGARRVAAPRQL